MSEKEEPQPADPWWEHVRRLENTIAQQGKEIVQLRDYKAKAERERFRWDLPGTMPETNMETYTHVSVVRLRNLEKAHGLVYRLVGEKTDLQIERDRLLAEVKDWRALYADRNVSFIRGGRGDDEQS